MKRDSKNTMKKSSEDVFPYEQFPVKVVHKDGKDLKDTKTCYFQNQNHADKYIARCKFTTKDYQISYNPKADLAPVGTSTRRKSTQKRSSRRQSSNS